MNIKEDLEHRAVKGVVGIIGTLGGGGAGLLQGALLPTYFRKSRENTPSVFNLEWAKQARTGTRGDVTLSDDPHKEAIYEATLAGSGMVSSAVARWGVTLTGIIDLMDGDIQRAGWIAVPWVASGLYELGRATYNHIYNKGVRDAQQGVARP